MAEPAKTRSEHSATAQRFPSEPGAGFKRLQKKALIQTNALEILCILEEDGMYYVSWPCLCIMNSLYLCQPALFYSR